MAVVDKRSTSTLTGTPTSGASRFLPKTSAPGATIAKPPMKFSKAAVVKAQAKTQAKMNVESTNTPASSPARPVTKVQNTGVVALAKEAGLSPQYVSMLFKQGKTRDEVMQIGERRAANPTQGRPSKLQQELTAAHDAKLDAIDEEILGVLRDTPGAEALVGHYVESIVNAQRRKEIALADKNELERDRIKASLLPVAQIKPWLLSMYMKSRDVLGRLGPDLADDLAGMGGRPVDIRKRIEFEVNRSLQEISSHGKFLIEGTALGETMKVQLGLRDKEGA